MARARSVAACLPFLELLDWNAWMRHPCFRPADRWLRVSLLLELLLLELELELDDRLELEFELPLFLDPDGFEGVELELSGLLGFDGWLWLFCAWFLRPFKPFGALMFACECALC